MDKDLKTRTRFTSTLNNELLERLRNVSQQTMIPMSKLIDKAIEEILKQYEQKDKS